MTLPTDQLERLAVDTIRTLSIDGVQQANSGHPGAPMGMAPMTFALWTKHLRHAPTDPAWPNRDRFVLSAGHASMLLYSMLHLTGYAVSLDDLKSFRQWGSITPGHPEYGVTPGVEATTGPLGQGMANGVGMAIAERRLAGEFNRPGHDVVDHRTYVICSDGDLQEGITAEACSLAGHLKLGKLIALYDDNRIQLDGPTAWTFTEDVVARFDAYGWHTQRVDDGNDVAAINAAIEAAKADDRPSLIAVRTHIGFGSPNKQDTQKAHGAPLGPEEVRLTKEAYGWDPDRTFYVPEEAGALFLRAVDAGRAAVAEWDGRPRCLRRGLPRRGRRAAPPRRRAPGGRLGRRAQRLRDGHRGGDAKREPGPDPVAGRPGPGAVRRLRGPLGVQPDGRQGAGPRPLRTRRTPAATSGSVSASTRWAASPTASPTTAVSSPTAPRSSPSATTCAALSGSRRCRTSTSSTSGPTTPSASARTARPTSRSSTTRPCARSRTCGSSDRATRTRRPRPGRSRWSARRSPARPPARWPWRSPGRSCPPCPARWSSRARACAGAGTSCARPGAAARRS